MIKKDYSQVLFIANLVVAWNAIVMGSIGMIVSIVALVNGVGTSTIFVIFLAYSVIAAFLGLVLIIVGKTLRACMDNTNYSAAILEELKQLNSVEKARN